MNRTEPNRIEYNKIEQKRRNVSEGIEYKRYDRKRKSTAGMRDDCKGNSM